MDMISGFLPQATAPSPSQGSEPSQTTAVKAESKASPKFSREDLQAVFAGPEVAKAIKQASKDGMKEGYLELMQRFMAELLPLFTSMLSSESSKDPKAAFDNLIGGLMSTINKMTGGNKAAVAEAPKIVVEGKPSDESSQANDMMKMAQQILSQAAVAK